VDLALILARGMAPDPLAEAREESAEHAQAVPAAAYHLLKASAEKRYTLGIGYAAGRPDVAPGKDAHLDFVGADALERAAWEFLQKGGEVGLHHEDGNTGRGQVVESYVYRGPNWPQAGGFTVQSGDWLLGIIWDDDAWAEIKKGRVKGYSLQGRAVRRRPSPAAVAALRR